MSNSILDTLNENQRTAATTINEHVRIIAGAGSGKTRVLMARIVYLVQDCGVLPNRILAITFTNKAANEMKTRLTAQLGSMASVVRISTIHSLCVRMLREDADLIGYPKTFAIMDPEDQKAILKPIYKTLEVDKTTISYNRALGAISAYKTNYIDPQMAANMAMDDVSITLAKIYAGYEKRRNEMKAMDFDDLLLEGHRLLNSVTSVREKWQNRLDYIHVDEFQDVDPIQYGIIKLLTGKNTHLCVVGDPDQTIYTWRGASVDIILKFNKDFEPCKTVILNENYRSTQPILDASNAVIKYNKERIDKDLYTKLPGDEKITMFEGKEDSEEPIFVARQINEKHKKGLEYKDMAILYRSNYSSRAFERIFKSVGIPYVIYGGIRFYERQEIKDALCYLRLCTNRNEEDPDQMALDLAVLRVINVPRRGIGARTIENLQKQAAQRHMNLYDVMKDPIGLSTAVTKKCEMFVDLIEDLRENREHYALEDFLDYVLDTTGYISMLKEDRESGQDRIDNLKELKEDIAQSMIEDPEMTLESYLQDIALFTDKTQETSENTVSLMTVHAAKGLEFDTVFLVNFNDGVFPSSRACDEGGMKALEEERRLLYVAMTRAKKTLYITWNTGFSYMQDAFKTPSRFRAEIPMEYIVQEEKEEAPKHPKVVVSQSLTGRPSKLGANKKKVRLRKGDAVEHTIYGQGVVLEIRGDVATIAFAHTIGVKKLNAAHPSIKKA